MTKKYEKNYHILGIQPGASWKQLRKAYKRLVNSWHPDRYQQDLPQRKLAEEKTKEITQAYKELAEYYNKFDSLPLANEETGNFGLETSEARPPPAGQSSPENQTTNASQTAESPELGRKSRFSTYRVQILTAAGLIGALYIILLLPGTPEPGDDSSVNEENPGLTTSNGKNEGPALQATNRNYFTIGSTIGEVYASQGIPTRTEENIWYYGNSKVFFSKGKVSGWEEEPENLLRINIVPDNNIPTTDYFRVGSTKQEVLAVQGPPDRDAGSVWDYGASRIYFKNKRVTDWYEAPFDRLKIRR